MPIELHPIGLVRTTRADPVDDNWDAETTRIELDPNQFTPDALMSLDHFSHIEVIYWFHHPEAEKPNLGARRPRGRADWPARCGGSEVRTCLQRGTRELPNQSHTGNLWNLVSLRFRSSQIAAS